MELSKIKTDVVNQAKNLNSTVALDNINILWRPHNYRLKIPINCRKIKFKKPLFYRVKYTERTSKYTIKTFKGFTIEVNPSSIIIIYSSKKWYNIKGTIQDFNFNVDKIVKDIENKCINKAEEISKLWKLKANFKKKIWVSHEDAVKGEEFLDKIDSSLVMHHSVFTKLQKYPFHFKSPDYLKNFINNRALENVAPIIVERLDKFTEVIEKVTNMIDKNTQALHLEIYNKQLHQKVLKDISATMKHLNSNILKVKYSGRRLSGLERMLIK